MTTSEPRRMAANPYYPTSTHAREHNFRSDCPIGMHPCEPAALPAPPAHEHRFDVVTAWEPQCRTRIVVRTADRVETTWTNRYEPCRWGDAERVVARKHACSIGDCTATREVAR